MNLRVDLYGSLVCGDNRHAQKIMKDFGIEYSEAIPQSLGDQWWFLDCTNVPEKLPPYITEMDFDPRNEE